MFEDKSYYMNSFFVIEIWFSLKNQVISWQEKYSFLSKIHPFKSSKEKENGERKRKGVAKYIDTRCFKIKSLD
jgi:hypothetical protein